MEMVALIVMEPGSEWPGHVRDSENIVAASHRDESLLQRTQHTLAALRQRGQRVRVAILACSDVTDGVSAACRAHLARELLCAVTAAGFGRLVLSSPGCASMELRRELLSLAATLSQTAPAASVRVRFDRESVWGRRSPPSAARRGSSAR